MNRARVQVIPALWLVAAAIFLFALVYRPHGLPIDSARYLATPVGPVVHRQPALGLTYAIDAVEVDGVERTPADPTPIRTSKPMIVHGWAVVPSTLAPGSRLMMSIDHRPTAAVVAYGLARPDVGAAISPISTNSGFAAQIDDRKLSLGPHIVQFAVADSAGNLTPLPTTVTFTLSGR